MVVTQMHPQKTQIRVIYKEAMDLCVECDTDVVTRESEADMMTSKRIMYRVVYLTGPPLKITSFSR